MTAKRSVAAQVRVLLALTVLIPAIARPVAAQAPAAKDASATVSQRAVIQARLSQTSAAADLNGDGLTDVVVTDFLSDSIVVRLAKPAGGFEPATRISAGRGPRGVVAADLNQDGHLDLAVGAFIGGTLHVLRGLGDGTFEESHVQPLGFGLSSIAAGDFDGDGLVDLAAANALTGRIGMLKNPGGAAPAHVELAQAKSPSLLLPVDADGDGRLELLAVSANGTDAHLVTGESQTQAVIPADLDTWLAGAAERGRTHSSADGRLVKRAGDGQLISVGSPGAEPLLLDVRDAAGEPNAGAVVAFTRVKGGAAISEARQTEHSATADLQGRISLIVFGAALPDSSVIAASESTHVEDFGLLSILENAEIAKLISAALSSSGADAGTRTRLELRLANAIDRLKEDDPVGAVRHLMAVVEDAPGGTSSGSAYELSLRFIDQILLAGASPRAVDTDPLVCNVTLTRTIATNSEIDALTLSAVAGERVYVAFANEGGITGFNPVWRMLAPGGSPVTGCGTLTTVSLDCTLPAGGTYTIEVSDSGTNATGTYSIQVQRLRSAERCGGTIGCDVAQSGSLGATGRADSDVFSFNAAVSERVHISLTELGGVAAFNPVWRLLLPDGSPHASCGTFTTADRDCSLSVAGSYAIHIADSAFDGSGTYGIHVQHLTAGQRCGGAIACNVTGAHSLGGVNLADTNLHSFDGAAGERIYVTLSNQGTSPFNPVWRLIAPDGTLVPGCSAFTTAFLDCTLPSAGSYAVEVSDSNQDASGTYSLQIQRLTSGNRCDISSIGCDSPVASSIGAAGDADTNLHSFTSVAGEIVSISLTNHGGATGWFPLWRLLLPNGAPDPSCGAFSSGMRSCQLSVAGSYAIHVADNFHDSTGTYGLHVQRLTAAQRCGGTVNCNATTTTTVGTTNTADTNLHSFPGAVGERIYVVLTNAGGTLFAPVWRLVAPDGSLVAGCSSFTTAPRDCTIPAAGSYAIEVADSNLDGSGTYELHIQRLTAGQRCDGSTIGCDTPQTAALGSNGPADTDLYSFSSTPGEVVRINIGNHGGSAGFFPIFRLLLPDGSPTPDCGAFGGPRDCTLSLNGSYAIHVADNFHDATGTYSVQVQRLTAAQRCGGTIGCDTSISNSVGAAARADSNLHSFSAVANERVYIAFASDNAGAFAAIWRLLSPAGTPVPGCSAFTTVSQDCTLPAAGSYAIEVLDNNLDGSGTYHLNVQRLTHPQRCGTALTCGSPLNSSIGTPIRADSNIHTFNGSGGQSVNVTVGNAVGAGLTPIYRLLLPDGSPTASCGTFAAAGTRTCALTVSGSYAVHVVDNFLDGGGTYNTTVSGAGCVADGLPPDMVISALKSPAKAAAGATINVRPTTQNAGTGPSGPTTTKLFLSNNKVLDGGDVQLGTDIAVAGLQPGANQQDSRNVTIPANTAPGKKFILAVADANGAQTESNEANNTRAKTITIGPDLVVSAIVAPATATPGATISVTITTKNVGGAPVNVATTTRLYFSNNNSIDAGDPFQTLNIGPLAVNASQSHTVNVTIPAGTPLGKRFLIGEADAGKVVVEAVEKNTKNKAITIQ